MHIIFFQLFPCYWQHFQCVPRLVLFIACKPLVLNPESHCYHSPHVSKNCLLPLGCVHFLHRQKLWHPRKIPRHYFQKHWPCLCLQAPQKASLNIFLSLKMWSPATFVGHNFRQKLRSHPCVTRAVIGPYTGDPLWVLSLQNNSDGAKVFLIPHSYAMFQGCYGTTSTGTGYRSSFSPWLRNFLKDFAYKNKD